jgi:hypothetical protein
MTRKTCEHGLKVQNHIILTLISYYLHMISHYEATGPGPLAAGRARARLLAAALGPVRRILRPKMI